MGCARCLMVYAEWHIEVHQSQLYGPHRDLSFRLCAPGLNPVLKNCKLRLFVLSNGGIRLVLRKFFVNGCQRQENPNSR